MGDIVDGMFQDGLLDWCAEEDEEAEYDGRQPSHGVTCRHCGATRLWWFPLKRGQYRLMNPGGTQHNCQRVPASIDEFEDCATSTTQTADGAAVER